ncbi:MAG: DUF3307 domain-containing protein [Elusimicrobia bacterium]|nr:DUF3307 domain-containing protein [Elusimicrobiota bacterium]
MIIFWRLLFGHFLADFTFQTNFINAWKRRSLKGLLVHCGMHPLFYLVLTWPYLDWHWVNTPWLRLSGWSCILIIFVLHFLEDFWRIHTIEHYRTPDNTIYLLWDQVIHFACLFVFLPIGLSDMSDGWVPEKWPVVGILAIGVTHFATVFIYFLEKDFFGGSYPGTDEKYLAILMRLVWGLCFLLPGSWWSVPVLLWGLNLIYLKRRRIIDFSWFSINLGGVLCVVFGWLARLVWYS